MGSIPGKDFVFVCLILFHIFFFSNTEPSMAFNRHSLMSRLRPLVAEVSTSSEASSLTLNEKVERLREALLAESPEIIRKF